MLDADSLRAYMQQFWGFGNPGGDLWFVGMEQGGGESADELERRLRTWVDRGRGVFDDLPEYCAVIGGRARDWFGSTARVQPTWRHLIRIALAAEGRPSTRDDVRRYQCDALGRRTGTTCLLELLPLPSRSMTTWRYGEWTSLPELRDRETYLTQVGTKRETGLGALIDQYVPRAVVFYGLGYKERWHRVVGGSFESTGIEGVASAQRGSVLCVLVPHPVAHGTTSSAFESTGHFISARARRRTS